MHIARRRFTKVEAPRAAETTYAEEALGEALGEAEKPLQTTHICIMTFIMNTVGANFGRIIRGLARCFEAISTQMI